MKESRIAPLAILAAMALPAASAAAFDINKDHKVTISYDDVEVKTGILRCEPPEYVEEIDHGHPASFCQYICRWTNANQVPLTTNTYLLERMTSGHYDCEDNSQRGFITSVISPGSRLNRGFDHHNTKRRILALTAGEDRDGKVTGTVVFENLNYVPYAINITDASLPPNDPLPR